MGESIRSPRSFIHRWLGVLGTTFFNRPTHQPYRHETAPRYKRSYTSPWRKTVGGATWVGKKAARKHKKWLAHRRQVSAIFAAEDAKWHAIGYTAPTQHRSSRTTKRRLMRVSAKHMGVPS